MGLRDSDRTGDAPADHDATLMLRFRAGDEAAFTELVRSFQGRVVSLAARYLGSYADAEDLAQEVFLRVYRARENYEPTARFSTWVYRITVNASLNHIRGRRVRRKIGAPLPSGSDDGEPAEFADRDSLSAAEQMEEDELATVLREIVEELPERQRIALLLNKYEGLSYEDTAAAMELTVSAVKSLLTRARLNVKELLVPYLEEGVAPRRETAREAAAGKSKKRAKDLD